VQLACKFAKYKIMKTTKLLLLLGSLLPGALISFDVQADIIIGTQTPVYDPTAFSNQGGYKFDNILLPSGTSIGSTALNIDIPLSTSINLTSLGTGYNYSFGMSGFNPLIPYNSEAFTFYIELLNNGTPITPNFSYLIANPSTFGFTEINPFDPINFPGVSPLSNLYVSTSTGALDPSLTFNEIDLEVFNNSQNEGVTDFNVELGVNAPAVVPETTTVVAGALMLLPFGASALRRLRRRQVA
jgi:hypothetical protein